MKIISYCTKCGLERRRPIAFPFSITENGLYHFKCEYGHDNLLQLQAFKFEILFQSGLCAIKESFFIESVLSITASLERFYEFYIKFTLGKDGSLSEMNITKTFKTMSRQSERQYGAFIALYSLIKKSAPPMLLSNRSTHFRNKVVHKGYIPTKEETLKFAKEVYYIIKFYYIDIRENNEEGIRGLILQDMRTRYNDNIELIKSTGVNIGTMGIPFAISQATGLDFFKKQDFEYCWNEVLKNEIYK